MAKKIHLWVDTGFAGCKHEDVVDAPDDWDEMTEEAREEHLAEEARDFMANYIDYGARVEDEA